MFEHNSFSGDAETVKNRLIKSRIDNGHSDSW